MVGGRTTTTGGVRASNAQVRQPLRSNGSTAAGAAAAAAENGARVEELEARVSEMKLTVDSLERERDFYYGKLREIEVLCQGHEESASAGDAVTDKQLVPKILDILYATEDGFAVPDEASDAPPFVNDVTHDALHHQTQPLDEY